jgi:endoglucanase
MPFAIRRGTNVSHWLSQSGARGQERRDYFTRDDAEWLARLGLDHLRIPADEEQLWDADGRREEEAFGLLADALDWCADCGLRAVIDLHILRDHHFLAESKPLFTDPAALERFCDLWRDLSDAFGDRPLEMVAYELLNEAVAEEPADWNRVAHAALAAVREGEPERVVVLGSNKWNAADTFDTLDVPDDPPLILTFHFYQPLLLTHYTASWTPLRHYDGPVHYPGRVVTDEEIAAVDEETRRALDAEATRLAQQDEWMRKQVEQAAGHYDRDVLEGLMAKPLAAAERAGLPLYCGEWGCIKAAPEPDRLRWYADMRSILEGHGIAWATWDYKSGHFGLRPGGETDEALIAVLTA